MADGDQARGGDGQGSAASDRVLDADQVAMILTLERQNGRAPGLIDMFDQQVRGGLDRLTAAAASQEWSVVGREAHALKGTAALYGLPRLASSASQLEEIDSHDVQARVDDLVHRLQHDVTEGIAALRASVRNGGNSDSS